VFVQAADDGFFGSKPGGVGDVSVNRERIEGFLLFDETEVRCFAGAGRR
jgi:hypothetical protein